MQRARQAATGTRRDIYSARQRLRGPARALSTQLLPRWINSVSRAAKIAHGRGAGRGGAVRVLANSQTVAGIVQSNSSTQQQFATTVFAAVNSDGIARCCQYGAWPWQHSSFIVGPVPTRRVEVWQGKCETLPCPVEHCPAERGKGKASATTMLAAASMPPAPSCSTAAPAKAERVFTFDTEQFPLRGLVQCALGVSELETLHEHAPAEFPQWGSGLSSLGRGSVDARQPQRRVELLRHALNERWKGSPQRKQWEHEFLPRLVREVVGPSSSWAGEERLLFQRSPLLRFHVAWPLDPGETLESAPPVAGFGTPGCSRKPPGCLAMLHKDHDTGHAPSEVNFLLPVNMRTHGSNSLWVESSPRAGASPRWETRPARPAPAAQAAGGRVLAEAWRGLRRDLA